MRFPRKRVADLVLGQPTEKWIRERLDRGQSWPQIRDELRDFDSELTFSVVTLKTWLDNAEQKSQAAS